MSNFDNKYLKKWLCVPGYDRRFKKIYQEMTLTGISGFLIVRYCIVYSIGRLYVVS
jgi:hypothetical protein